MAKYGLQTNQQSRIAQIFQSPPGLPRPHHCLWMTDNEKMNDCLCFVDYFINTTGSCSACIKFASPSAQAKSLSETGEWILRKYERPHQKKAKPCRILGRDPTEPQYDRHSKLILKNSL
jgi:hypothetical protein